MSRRFGLRPETLRADAVAGLVLGVESIPDGLATGLLAGVNPIAGLYGYMVGTVAGALTTSSAFMAIQGTGAMAVLVADVPEIHHAAQPASGRCSRCPCSPASSCSPPDCCASARFCGSSPTR